MRNGYDLLVTDASGAEQGYVLYNDTSFGQPCIHKKETANVNTANVGGDSYIDYAGDKSVSFLDWSFGAGQTSYDAEDASPSMFHASTGIDVRTKGQLTLERGSTFTSGKPSTAAGFMFAACGVWFWAGTATAALKVASDPTGTWSDVTNGTDVGIVCGWATDGTRIWVCSKADTANAIYVLTGSGATWSAALYGTDGTDEKVHAIAYNAGLLFAAVESAAGMRVALVDQTTGAAAAYDAASNLTSPVMLGTSSTVALVNCGNAVYWVTSLGNRCTLYEITYDPTSQAMYTEQYAEMPSDFICTCATGYLSAIYLGGYYWSTTTGVGQGAVYMVQDNWASPLFELGAKPEYTPLPADSGNDNRINSICEAGKDLYVTTNRALYRWDIDGGGYVQELSLYDATGTSAAAWEASDFDASDLPTFFPTGWTAPTDELTKTLTDGWYALLTGVGLSTGYVTTPSVSHATGTSFEIGVVGRARWAGQIDIVLDDGTTRSSVTIAGTGAIGYPEVWVTYGGVASAKQIMLNPESLVRIVSYNHYTYVFVCSGTTMTATTPCICVPTDASSAAGVALTFNNYSATDGPRLYRFDWDNSAWFPNGYSVAPQVYSCAYNKGVVAVNYRALTTAPSTYTYYTATKNMGVYQTSGWLESSTTSLKSGTVAKDWRSVDVAHKPLEGDAALAMKVSIDGVDYVLAGEVVSAGKTRFAVNQTGYAIQYVVTLTAGTSGATTPTVNAITLVYENRKSALNSYVLHCAQGARTGTWMSDPQAAISFLFTAANQRCTFEDVFNGEYTGTISEVQFLKANYSPLEGYSGVVLLQVREEE